MGMTEEQFFHGDPALCKAYRDAWEQRQKYERDMSNWRCWLMGGYVYQAMCLTAPAFNSLKPHKPGDYPSEPIKFDDKQTEQNPLFEYMKSYADRHNKQRNAGHT